ncbi:hypothetical protein CPB83DRAFT_858217 [Crepidotus variabilis]|uniref:Uncharacterized protein n=1 Tax=Crepidotus variabilis TaxID=179855 RepID=A0A9P6EBT4_9AGAR|nr:hypothetical protein CPB83DRAFT_858217 [Crepidotus variabilis]
MLTTVVPLGADLHRVGSKFLIDLSSSYTSTDSCESKVPEQSENKALAFFSLSLIFVNYLYFRNTKKLMAQEFVKRL